MKSIKPPSMNGGDIAVWVLGRESTAELHDRTEYLSAAELHRATTIARLNKRQEFIAARVALRLLLANHLDIDPKTITFEQTTGQPRVCSYPMQCSVSHRHGAIAVAMSSQHQIGIDLEQLRPTGNELFRSQMLFGASCATGVTSEQLLAAWCELEALTKLRGKHLLETLPEWRQIINRIGLPDRLPADRTYHELRFSHWEPFPMSRLVLVSCKPGSIKIQIDE